MRISISYKVSRIPIAYRMLMLSLVKEALRRSDERYYRMLYEERSGQMKPFGSAVFLRNFKLHQDDIELDEVTLTLSSSDMEFMLHAFNGFQLLQEYRYGDETWKRTKVMMLPEAQLQTGRAVFRTMSPILIEQKDGKPVHPGDDNYEQEFAYYAALRIKELAGRQPYQAIHVKPLSMRKQIVRETNSESRYKGTLYFTTYKGSLEIGAHPEDLQFLYANGIGKRASQFFGLLDLEREEG